MKTLTKSLIHTDNWSTSRFLSEEFQAFISLGGAPDPKQGMRLQYIVTLADKEFCEMMQKNFDQLEEALSFLNKKYGHWQFSQVDVPKSGDGCSSCAAH